MQWWPGLEKGYKRSREEVAVSGTRNGTGNVIGSNKVEGLGVRASLRGLNPITV